MPPTDQPQSVQPGAVAADAATIAPSPPRSSAQPRGAARDRTGSDLHDHPGLAQIAGAMRRNGWSLGHLAMMIVLAGAAVWLTWDGWADLTWLAWNDAESSQILLVPILGLWLLWYYRRRPAQVSPHFSIVGPAFMLLGWAAWEYSYYNNLRVASHFAAVALPLGAILCVCGSRLLWKLLPVFGVLIFAIPVPHRIRLPLSVPLQRITAQATEHLMQLFNLGVTRAGSVLTINGHDVGVAEACNGMRGVFAVFLVTYLVVFISEVRPVLRIVVLLLAPAVALFCNILRLGPTVYLYGYFDHDIAEQFHDISGWVMNGVAFGLLLGLMALVRWVADDNAPSPRLSSQTAGA